MISLWLLYTRELVLAELQRAVQIPAMAPEAAPQLVFPSAVDSLQADRGQIRQQLRDTQVYALRSTGRTQANPAHISSYNRLHSIAADADFVRNQVGAAYPDFPLVGKSLAN